MTEQNENKIPQGYRVVILLDIDIVTYDGKLLWGKTPEQIKKEVAKNINIKLPAPCHDYHIESIEEIYEDGHNALTVRIDKITHGGAL